MQRDYRPSQDTSEWYNLVMIKSISITGGKPLSGTVRNSGAKNGAPKMIIASLLTDEPVILHNVPQLGEAEIAAEICQQVGTKVTFRDGSMRLETPEITQTRVEALSRRNRLPVLALPALLHRAGEAKVPVLGGDAIGPRPVNYHLAAMREMGAHIEETEYGYEAETRGLHGTAISLPYPSVGATENIIFAAVLAKGRTTITNAATEPEITDCIKLLQQMGAIIEFRADRVIVIDGVTRLHGAEYRVMSDRNEAASLGLLGVITGGEILVQDANQDHLITFLNTLRRVGADYRIEPDGIRFFRGNGKIRGAEIETDTHPGYMTDWQQPMAVLLTQAEGLSVIHETVFEDRFGYTETLREMGANIGVFSKCLGELTCRYRGRMHPHSAIIQGPTPLHATQIEIPDIRAGMAQVLAALVAEGTSEITGMEHLMRGYEDILGKLRSVGADIRE
jgi:UDP-N-acetylglucosamine 1-carboxyvinyltransferase